MNEKQIKESIKEVILNHSKDFIRFDMIETYIDYADEEGDVLFLLQILKNDNNSVIRHEAAAQLLKIQKRKPWLLEPVRKNVIEDLLNVVLFDASLVAKHESAEALSLIGDSTVLPRLDEIIFTNKDKKEELDETLKIVRDTIEYRIIKNIDAPQLSVSLLKDNNISITIENANK